MVMTAGTSRFRKTGSAGSTFDSTKDLIQDDHSETGVISTSVSDNVDMITNDQGDIFFGPAPKTSFKVVDDPFRLRYADTTWEEIKQGTWNDFITNFKWMHTYLFSYIKILQQWSLLFLLFRRNRLKKNKRENSIEWNKKKSWDLIMSGWREQ